MALNGGDTAKENRQPETKPYVPTMTEPIQWYSQTNSTKPVGSTFTNDVVNRSGDNGQTGDGLNNEADRPQEDDIDTDRVKEIMELIRKYELDKINSAIGTEAFYEKYPEGENALLMWQDELKGLIGEESFNEYMDAYSDWETPGVNSEITETIVNDHIENYGEFVVGEGSNTIESKQDKVFLDYISELFADSDDILDEVIKNAMVDKAVNSDVADLEDFSEELNEVIRKCCEEYQSLDKYYNPLESGQALINNALTWKEGVFNHWNFVGDTLWNDQDDNGYDSYIPDEIQGKAKDAQEDFFIVNGIRMNREQYGNYVKGATAQYAFPFLPAADIVNILGVGMSIVDNIEDNIKGNDDYNFTWKNEIEDSYFTYLGARDMMNGVLE